jgi:hypothetical protein
MALDPVTGALDLASTIVNKIWPDKSAQEQQQLAAVLAMVQGQMSANTAQASNPSVFVSGARPFIMWVCGFACAWNWLGISIAKTICAFLHYPIVLTAADTSEMMPMLTALLGLGAYRTVEKIKGVARNSLTDGQ